MAVALVLEKWRRGRRSWCSLDRTLSSTRAVCTHMQKNPKMNIASIEAGQCLSFVSLSPMFQGVAFSPLESVMFCGFNDIWKSTCQIRHRMSFNLGFCMWFNWSHGFEGEMLGWYSGIPDLIDIIRFPISTDFPALINLLSIPFLLPALARAFEQKQWRTEGPTDFHADY